VVLLPHSEGDKTRRWIIALTSHSGRIFALMSALYRVALTTVEKQQSRVNIR
jgi:hypothetical protein